MTIKKIYILQQLILTSTCTLSPSLHMCGASTILMSTPTVIDLGSMYCTEPIPPVAPLTWCLWFGPSTIDCLHRNTVNVTSPFKISKSHVITDPRWGTWIRTCQEKRPENVLCVCLDDEGKDKIYYCTAIHFFLHFFQENLTSFFHPPFSNQKAFQRNLHSFFFLLLLMAIIW